MTYVVKWTAPDAAPYLVGGGRGGEGSTWAPKQIWARRFRHQSEAYGYLMAAGQIGLLKDGCVKIVRLTHKGGA